MGKRLYFGSNLKMYKTISQTLDYLKELTERTKDISRDEITLFIIPSYTSLEDASRQTDHGLCLLGAQNMGWEETGQYTGEISPLMLNEIGMDLVMVGHSERRHVFRETDEEENRKVKCALEHGMRALLCIGETMEQKEFGISPEILRMQMKIGLHGIDPSFADRIWVAYEPVW